MYDFIKCLAEIPASTWRVSSESFEVFRGPPVFPGDEPGLAAMSGMWSLGEKRGS